MALNDGNNENLDGVESSQERYLVDGIQDTCHDENPGNVATRRQQAFFPLGWPCDQSPEKSRLPVAGVSYTGADSNDCHDRRHHHQRKCSGSLARPRSCSTARENISRIVSIVRCVSAMCFALALDLVDRSHPRDPFAPWTACARDNIPPEIVRAFRP